MIPAYEKVAQASRALDHLIRAAAVAHDVAEMHHTIVRWRCSKASFQRLKVAVDVAKQKYAQGAPGQTGDYRPQAMRRHNRIRHIRKSEQWGSRA